MDVLTSQTNIAADFNTPIIIAILLRAQQTKIAEIKKITNMVTHAILYFFLVLASEPATLSAISGPDEAEGALADEDALAELD